MIGVGNRKKKHHMIGVSNKIIGRELTKHVRVGEMRKNVGRLNIKIQSIRFDWENIQTEQRTYDKSDCAHT